jgi:hypothetical protein
VRPTAAEVADLDEVKAALARQVEEEKKRAEETKAAKEKDIGLCDYATFRYPDSARVTNVSLLSPSKEISGCQLTLDAGRQEWTTTLLVPVRVSYFQFLVNGKEKLLSPLHEKENTGFFGGWKNVVRIDYCSTLLKSYRRLPFPRLDLPLTEECM